MTPSERELALRRLDGLIDDLQRAAMGDNAERDLMIVLIYRVSTLAGILKQLLEAPA